MVTEGKEVKKGDILVKIENQDLLAKKEQAEGAIAAASAAIQGAQAQKQAASAVLEKAQNGARVQEIAQAKAAYDYATLLTTG